MLDEISQQPVLIALGAFVMGWVFARSALFRRRRSSDSKRDPRNDRIRSLEADHRVALAESERSANLVEALKGELLATRKTASEHKLTINEQFQKITQLRKDLKGSVRTTRELRTELTDRATESVKSQVKLRDVEIELDVSRASTDMIATGALDYALAPSGSEDVVPLVKKSNKAV